MIVEEILTINDQECKLTYSNNNKYIKQLETDKIFDSALDRLTSNFSYEETEIDLETD